MASTQPDAIERRIFTRHLVNARVQLVHSAIGHVNGRTRDISDSGVFIEIFPVPKLPNGSNVKMHMLDSSEPAIAFNMKVVRTVKDGIGLLFIDYEYDGQRYSIDTLREIFRNK